MERYQFDPVTHAALESLRVPLAVYQFLEKRVVTLVLSDGFCDTFEYTDKRQAYYDMDNDMYKATHPDDVARIANEAFRFATQGGHYEVVYRSLAADGQHYKIIHSFGEHVYMPEGVRLAYVWYTDEGKYVDEDDDERFSLRASFREAMREESIIKTGYFDNLTGLPEMSYFFELADAWRKDHFARGGPAVAILYMNLSGMKFYNRKYGFAAGDKLLRTFANLLKKHFSNENCSRFGSDQFCAFTALEGVGDKLRVIFDEFRDNGSIQSLPVRVGICTDTDGTLEVSAACDRAKYACDSMRNSFVSCFRYFDETMLEKAELRQYIIDHLDRAIDEGWIQVYHQPIIRAANGRVCDEEALSRWIDPERGFISPAVFIPILEEARLVYKLDLFVVEQVLLKLEKQKQEGLYVVSESVNLSRVDFDTCDIVEEIRRRVDAAGVSRELLSIELTESSVGNDFEYMKSQIERFSALGFPVWMDDFGSGYSSLDVLQSIRFDLVKFDMRFMKSFYEGNKSRIMIAELIRMAIALGIDTVCEGVETKDQVDFLREVGCTKLQGYYFCRPIPLDQLLERYRRGVQIGFENPEVSDYYAAIGKINLYDLASIAGEAQESIAHYFDTLPMAIYETNDEQFRLVRCNTTYRTFLDKTFGGIATGEYNSFREKGAVFGGGFLKAMRECQETGAKLFLDEELGDGSVVHALLKMVSVNPVDGTRAFVIAVLAVVDDDTSLVTFTHAAKALSTDYISLYYVDLKTDHFIEYISETVVGELSVEQHGSDFFTRVVAEGAERIAPEDYGMFCEAFTKENILRAINENGSFKLIYRRLIGGVPNYVSLKAVCTHNDQSHLVIGVTNIDAQMREKEAMERMREEQTTYARIAALSGSFICIYTVDPETSRYCEYIVTPAYEQLGIAKEGSDFFAASLRQCEQFILPEDLLYFRSRFTEENVLRDVRDHGVFRLYYRLLLAEGPTEVCLKAAMVEEKDGPKLIVGLKKTDGTEAIPRR